MEISIFVPCFIDQLFPNVAVSMVRVLRKLAQHVSYNPNQTCCGQPSFNAGFWANTVTVGNKFVKDLQGQTAIVCPSASCVGFVKNNLANLLEDASQKKAAQQVAARMFEFSDFLVNQLKIVDVGAVLNGKAVYHDSCAGLRECNIKTEPRALLSAVQGLTLLETADCEVCCGFGGSFSVKFEPISVAMAEQKVESALSLGANFIISTDMSCLMHLDGYIQHKRYPIKVLHIAEVLDMV
jgi:L-lactate dehydrogenase complex protein LldE